MSVDDWARREALREYGNDNNRPIYFADGIVHAFSALLSDEAVEALAQQETGWHDLWADERDVVRARVRAYLQAAVRAVTEGGE